MWFIGAKPAPGLNGLLSRQQNEREAASCAMDGAGRLASFDAFHVILMTYDSTYRAEGRSVQS
jgi:hypothetical protein